MTLLGERFYRYLRYKRISQKEISRLASVSESMVSRFCQGGAISSFSLQKMLQVCEDLSLEWLFFNSGEMIRSGKSVISSDGVVVADNLAEDKSHEAEWCVSEDLLFEKDRIIMEKDRIILERDKTIKNLHSLLGQ